MLRENTTILHDNSHNLKRFLVYVMAFMAESKIYHFHQVTLKKNKLRFNKFFITKIMDIWENL